LHLTCSPADEYKKGLSLDVLKGIYPGLKRVLDEQVDAINTHSGADAGKTVELKKTPDSDDAISTGECV
jgi:hypothetical protein